MTPGWPPGRCWRGSPCWTCPPSRLEELAGWVGNQGMAELLELQAGPAEEISFRMPEGELETEPFPVPESPGLLLDAPQGLTAQESPGTGL